MTSTFAHTVSMFDPRQVVVVDSNLLLLLAVGLWNPRAINTHKRLSAFTTNDFQLLREFLSRCSRVVTTAHILTEVSNLASSTSIEARQAILRQLASLIETLEEVVLPASSISLSNEFRIFGLTDAALSLLCTEMLLLTEDRRLANHLNNLGFSAITLQHLRSQ